jgi:hypothetical protein
MSNTGQDAALSRISATLSITSMSVVVANVAVATALPKTSCAQVTTGVGVMAKVCDIKRRSRLSRGRRIKRCAQRLTC